MFHTSRNIIGMHWCSDINFISSCAYVKPVPHQLKDTQNLTCAYTASPQM